MSGKNSRGSRPAGMLSPDMLLSGYSDVTPELLADYGARALVCDIDNTLVTYDDAEPTPEVLAWLAALRRSGIAVGFISNNKQERVARFNAGLGFPAYAESGKPSVRHLRRLLAELGTSPGEAALLGDQLFTDVLAARRMGMTALLVPPIRDKRTLFFRFKRLCEKPFLRAWRKGR